MVMVVAALLGSAIALLLLVSSSYRKARLMRIATNPAELLHVSPLLAIGMLVLIVTLLVGVGLAVVPARKTTQPGDG